MVDLVRILFVADSHLGFDLPLRPRVQRPRRGHDFLRNYATALAPAFRGEADIVVHGGDVFDRPMVPPAVAYQALEPLRQIAERGIPVFVVPGNHERARIPHVRFAAHPRVHVFDRARTYDVNVRGTTIAFSGFPYERRLVRTRFPELLECTDWRKSRADHRLLCFHHCVEGATVGPGDFTFTSARDVVRARDLPAEFNAVLSGHIHRHQVLTRDLQGRALRLPVFYPGSIERTATAEIGERKGFLLLTLEPKSGRVRGEFRELPARPLIVKRITTEGVSAQRLDAAVRAAVNAAPATAVLTIRITGELDPTKLRCLSARHLRSYVPETMIVEIRTPRPVRNERTAEQPLTSANLQLELD